MKRRYIHQEILSLAQYKYTRELGVPGGQNTWESGGLYTVEWRLSGVSNTGELFCHAFAVDFIVKTMQNM